METLESLNKELADLEAALSNKNIDESKRKILTKIKDQLEAKVAELQKEENVSTSGSSFSNNEDDNSEFKTGAKEQFEENRQAIDEFFTPKWVAEYMYQLAVRHGFKGGNVSEPSLGKGVFLDVLLENGIPAKDIYGFEIYKPNFDYVKAKYPDANIFDYNFEYNFTPNDKELKRDGINISPAFKKAEIDMFIGNPPYGSHRSPYSYLWNKNLQVRYEGFFIYLCLKKLKPGGLVVFIINSLWLNNKEKYNKQKEAIAELGDMVEAFRLPNGIFKGENRDTSIATDIVIFRKK